MTTEELLKPRYKVIADYPNCTFSVGQVLVQDDKEETDFWTGDQLYTDRYPKQYPHLFKKLEWWEERKPEDMPEYVKDNTSIPKVIRKVDKHFWNERYEMKEFKPDENTYVSEKRTYNYNGHSPATEE